MRDCVCVWLEIDGVTVTVLGWERGEARLVRGPRSDYVDVGSLVRWDDYTSHWVVDGDSGDDRRARRAKEEREMLVGLDKLVVTSRMDSRVRVRRPEVELVQQEFV